MTSSHSNIIVLWLSKTWLHYCTIGYEGSRESSNLLIGTSITMTVSVIMALVSLIALTASIIVCCKRPHSKGKAEAHPVYYSTISERAAADPTYDEVSSTIRAKDINTKPNEAYHPVSVLEPNEAYHTSTITAVWELSKQQLQYKTLIMRELLSWPRVQFF